MTERNGRRPVPRLGWLVAGLAIVVATGACPRRSDRRPDTRSAGARRPYNFKVPKGYDRARPTPLVILLHGYDVLGSEQESYYALGAIADEQTFLYAYPDGSADRTGRQFWNADDACCDFFGSGVDDVAYLNGMIDDIARKYTVDGSRIFVVGHSNGGFMAHRLACDLSNRIAAIVALAGVVWNDSSKCQPRSPVSVLDVHGDRDRVVGYGGGAIPAGFLGPGVPSNARPPYPSEAQTLSTWAAKNGCTGALAPDGVVLDLDRNLPGSETIESAVAGCPRGVDVKLWTIVGGAHGPALAQPAWGEAIYGFLKTHPKL